MKQHLLLSGFLILPVAGCLLPQPSDRLEDAQGPTSGRAELATDILGSWKLISVAGEPVPADQLTVSFRQYSFQARVNCNRVSGRYMLRGSAFIPEQAIATEMGCGPEYPFDELVTRALQFGMNLAMPSKDRLEAQTSEGRLVLVRTAIPGTHW